MPPGKLLSLLSLVVRDKPQDNRNERYAGESSSPGRRSRSRNIFEGSRLMERTTLPLYITSGCATSIRNPSARWIRSVMDPRRSLMKKCLNSAHHEDTSHAAQRMYTRRTHKKSCRFRRTPHLNNLWISLPTHDNPALALHKPDSVQRLWANAQPRADVAYGLRRK